MKYIVCNSENAVFNRVYDELEKFIEQGAVFSFSEKIIGTQFAKRMVDEYNNGKYKYNHIIFLGQRELTNIDVEEDFGIYRAMRKNVLKPLGVDYKNIYYPTYELEEDLEKFKNIVAENPIDVALLFVDGEGNILNYSTVTDDNKDLHLYAANGYDKKNLQEQYGVDEEIGHIISLGFDNIMAARNIFLIILGEDKKKYAAKIFEEETDSSTLALLKTHRNLTVFVDKEASYKSEEEANKLIRAKERKREMEQLKRLEQETKSDK